MNACCYVVLTFSYLNSQLLAMMPGGKEKIGAMLMLSTASTEYGFFIRTCDVIRSKTNEKSTLEDSYHNSQDLLLSWLILRLLQKVCVLVLPFKS